jgi:hypothetical protein
MRIRGLALGGTAMVLLAACGSSGPLDDKTADEVTAAAADALEEAGAVHATGSITQDGEEVEVDLQLQGDDVAGSLTMGGAEVEIISVDGVAYMQAPPEFWGSFGMPEEAAAMFDGQWVIVPDDAMADFSSLSLAGIADQLRNPDGELEEEVRDEERDGQKVVVVQQEDGSELVVANEDPSYPLEVSGADGEGRLVLSGFGEEEEIEAPADAIDLADLGA